MPLEELLPDIEGTPLSTALVHRVQSILPADDGELDQWLGDALQRMAHNEFLCLICAAIASGRHVDPRHLARGGIVLAAAEMLPEIVMRMPAGEVPEYLLQMGEVNIPRRHKALMLAVTALWCRLHRNAEFPAKLIAQARDMARDQDDDQSIPNWLAAVALITKDQGLLGVLRRTYPIFARDIEWKKLMAAEGSFERQLMAIPEQSIFDRLGDGGGRLLAHGTTMRRAVERVGRNEPCPCGSGKKYKKCCYDKDQERLRHSTSIEGVTTDELDAAPEAHLDAKTFADLPWERLQRIDAGKLPESLLTPYFERLLEMETFERIVEDFEKVGYSETLHVTWRTAALRIAARRRPELLERLVTLRRNAGFEDHDLDDIICFCLAEGDPAEWLAFLEERMDNALYDDDPNALMHLAQAAAHSSYPAIGVFVCRAVAPLLEPEQAGSVIDDLMNTRDRLGHVAEDPITDVLQKLAAHGRDEAEHSETERELSMALDATRRELRELKEKVKSIERELERAEVESAENARANAIDPENNPYAVQLRRTLSGVKSELKNAYNEASVYRRKWEEAQREADKLKQQPRTAPQRITSAVNDSGEEDLLLPEDPFTPQPVRLIAFERDFEARLRQAPRQVARTSMIVAGKLASGDSATFHGAVRLKAAPTMTRVRIGEWRLLFRLLADRIEFVDLIPRQELNRRIKTLT